jgi:dCTP deaminase
MSVLSAQSIRKAGLVTPMRERAEFYASGKPLTYGLGPAGYDVTLDWGDPDAPWTLEPGEFRLAATLERFDIPNNVMGFIYDKSSWARQGLSLFNTVIEPNWRGYLTLELVNNGPRKLYMHPGTPIAHVVFQWLDEPTQLPYAGKYQDQEAGPQEAR